MPKMYTRAPEPLPILYPSNFVPKNGFPVVKGLRGIYILCYYVIHCFQVDWPRERGCGFYCVNPQGERRVPFDDVACEPSPLGNPTGPPTAASLWSRRAQEEDAAVRAAVTWTFSDLPVVRVEHVWNSFLWGHYAQNAKVRLECGAPRAESEKCLGALPCPRLDRHGARCRARWMGRR